MLHPKSVNLRKIVRLIEDKSATIVLSSVAIYIVAFSFISIWKFFHFGYNAIDLAIFNQVFYNTSMGDLFSMTIHPHSYLGDHFEVIILLLTPFYMLLRSPVTLLVLQTTVLGFSAWPLFLIAKKIANTRIGLFIVAIYLLNPFIQNMNLFEFHILPFAILTLFFAFYYYLDSRFNLFLLFTFLSLLIREDVALVVIMFSFISLIDKKSKKWILTPAVIGAGWLAMVFWISPMLNNYDSYKFLFYYSWLGNSIGEIIQNFFSDPLLVLTHVFSLQNVFLFLALFLPFLLLPFLKPKHLLLSLLVFIQLLLGSFSGELTLKTHYSALLLVSVFITTIYSLEYLFISRIKEKPENFRFRIKSYILKEPALFVSVFIAVTVYGTVTFGPIIPAIQAISSNQKNESEFTQLKRGYVGLIPDNSSVTTSYDLLPNLSSRKYLYSLHYAFLGKKQYSDNLYTLPPTDYMLIDTKDLLTYQIQFPDDSFYQDAYSNGDDNIRSILEKQELGIISTSDDLLLFGKNVSDPVEIYRSELEKPTTNSESGTRIIEQSNPVVAPGIDLFGYSQLPTNPDQHPKFNIPFSVLPVALYFHVTDNIYENYQLLLSIKNAQNDIIYEKYYALGYGIFPSAEWKKDNFIKTNYWFYIPKDILPAETASISFVKLKDDFQYLGLDGLLTATMKNVEYETAGGSFDIPLSSIITE
ncbi:MAG: DUF2079 domain-containing protein [Patescibacteria group bacterium]